MKPLNKPKIVIAVLSVVVGFFWFFSHSFLSFTIEKEAVNNIENAGIYSDVAAAALFAFGIYFCHIQLKKKNFYLQDQYFKLFTAHPSPMGIVDLATKKFLVVNRAAIDTYGYTNEEFLSITAADIKAEEDMNPVEKDLKNVSSELKMRGIRRHRKKNGQIILAEVSSSEVYFKNKRCVLLLSNDITEIVKAKEGKRIAEEEKLQQQNFTDYILENFPVDVAIFDKDHRYIFLNKTAVKNEEMRKWMIGKDDFDYFRRKGTDVTIPEKRRERFINAVKGQSKEWIDEYKVDGKMKYILRNFFPCYEDGHLKHVYGYGMDITEVKKAQLQRDEYIAQLEDIAFITSHKIRQPICNMQGLVSLLEMEKPEGRDIQNIILCMQKSVIIMDDFTKDLAIKLHEYKQTLSAAQGDT